MSTPAGPPDGGGPMVALCVGPACSASHEMAQCVREAVASTRGAVLVTTGCLGPCALAPVGAVAHRPRTGGRSGPTVWLRGMDDPERAEALAAWVRNGGPGSSGEPDEGMPATLVPAAVAVGAPMRFGAG